MIPKVICFIFGHIRFGKQYLKDMGHGYDLWHFVPVGICLRCGVKLKWKEQREMIKDFIKAYKGWRLKGESEALIRDIASYVRDWDGAGYQPSIIQAVEEDKVREWWLRARNLLGMPTASKPSKEKRK